MTADVTTLTQALPELRPRLVRRARRLGVDAEVAEDLAQESLYEAWRLRDRVYDPAGIDRWLFAILTNVHRRWVQRRGRELALDDGGSGYTPGGEVTSGDTDRVDDTVDLEVELERRELVELLDKALAVLPAGTRDVLVHRFVHETPIGELAGRLGLSEGAVQMRVQRGKLALHRVLTTDFADDAVSYGLIDEADAGWQQTRIWCPCCARERWRGRFTGPKRGIELGCHELMVVQDDTRPYGVTGFRATLRHLLVDAYRYWYDGMPGLADPQHRLAPRTGRTPEGLHYAQADCRDCDLRVATTLAFQALCTPDGRRFWHDNQRIRRVGYQELEAGGVPAVLTSYQSATSAARLDVVLTRDTFRLVRSSSS